MGLTDILKVITREVGFYLGYVKVFGKVNLTFICVSASDIGKKDLIDVFYCNLLN